MASAPWGLEQQKDKSFAFKELYPSEKNDAWRTKVRWTRLGGCELHEPTHFVGSH